MAENFVFWFSTLDLSAEVAIDLRGCHRYILTNYQPETGSPWRNLLQNSN